MRYKTKKHKYIADVADEINKKYGTLTEVRGHYYVNCPYSGIHRVKISGTIIKKEFYGTFTCDCHRNRDCTCLLL